MLKICYWILLLALFAGCATGVKTEHDPAANFSQYRSFAWLAPQHKQLRDPILDSELLDKRVRLAVNHVLSTRGYTPAEGEPDFRITYHTASKERLRSPAFTVGVGYSRYYTNWGHAVLFDGPGVESYEEAVLVIDIIDAGSDKLVWRGWDTSLLNQRNFSQSAIDKAVTEILDAFPPAR